MLQIRDIAQPTAPTNRRTCQHCSTPFTPRHDETFCCAGCESVYVLIESAGWDARYYSHKNGMSEPVLEAPFIERNWGWLEEISAEAADQSPVGTVVLGITGISCQSCVWLAEKIIDQCDQIGSSKVILSDKSLHIKFLPQADLPTIARELQRYGFIVEPKPPRETPQSPSKVPLIFSAVFVVNALLFQLPMWFSGYFELGQLFNQMSLIFGVLALITIGHYIFNRRLYQRALRS